MKDIAPELLKKLQESFREKFKNSEKIKLLNKKLANGNVTYKEANEMAAELGDILTKVYSENLSTSILPDERMYYNIGQRVIGPTMAQNYELMSEYAKETQTIINKSCGLGIKGVKSELNQNRIDGIIDKLDRDSFEKTKWLLDEPIKNFIQSIVDDTVRINAEKHHMLGLSPKIIRTEVGDCCKWCKAVAGVYDYESVKDTGNNVFRRHRFCRCTVEYAPGNNKRQNVHSKAWKTTDKSDIIKARKDSFAKSKIIHKDDIQTKTFAKGSGKNYPIRFIGKDHVKFGSEVVSNVTVIAGKGVSSELRDSVRLENLYHRPRKRWQKISGETEIFYKGKLKKVEIHWYEVNQSRYEIKVKKVIDDES